MDARGYQYFLDYAVHAYIRDRYSLTELLDGAIDADRLEGKVVLVGSTAESVPDFFYTPFSPSLTADHQTPGVMLHALAVDQLIRSVTGRARPLTYLDDRSESLWIFLWGLAGALLALRIRSTWRGVLVAAAGTVLLVAVTFLLFDTGRWLPVVPALFAWLASGAIVTVYVANREARQRRLLMNLFSRHVDPKLAAAIWEERDRFLEGGRPSTTRLTATIMFVDLQGFARIGERLGPEELMEWLNAYMGAMTPLVMEHGGVVMRFIGDAIMAGFGVPLPRDSEEAIREDARNAVRCALAMEGKVLELNRGNGGDEHAMIGMRVGICTGPMVGGSMGDEQRLEYNVHGDSVNTAARLEGFEKQSFVPDYDSRPCRILIGASTKELLDGTFATEAVGEVALRGKQERLAVYQVLGLGQATSGNAGD
jgi:adenylate cyclase